MLISILCSTCPILLNIVTDVELTTFCGWQTVPNFDLLLSSAELIITVICRLKAQKLNFYRPELRLGHCWRYLTNGAGFYW